MSGRGPGIATERRLSGARLWTTAEPAFVTSVVTVLVAAQPFRGLNLWALWMVEATERVAAWRRAGGSEALGWDPNGVMPLGPMLSSAVPGGDGLLGARVVTAVAAGLLAGLVFAWCRRVGGRFAGWFSVGALLVMPRFWSAATTPTPTMVAVAGAVALWVSVGAARRRPSAVWLSVIAGGLALASGLPAYTAVVPLAWITFVAPGTVKDGTISLRAVPLWLLLLPLAWVGVLWVMVAASGADLVGYFTHMVPFWLELPPEPFLAFGKLWGVIRMPPWLPAALLGVMTPPAILLGAASYAWVRSQLPGEDRRELLAFWLWALLLPVILRSVYHGGVDLVLLSGVALALTFGVSVGALLREASWRPAVLSVAVAALIVSASDVARAAHAWEGWRSGLVGGATGQAMRGTGRYPHGPVPVDLIAGALDDGARRVHILTNSWEIRPVFEAYVSKDLLPSDAQLVSLEEAEVVLIALDDTLPELYDVASDWSRFVNSSPSAVDVLEVDGIPLFGVGVIGAR